MGSQGDIHSSDMDGKHRQGQKSCSLASQGSINSLTLDEVQNHLGDSGKQPLPIGSSLLMGVSISPAIEMVVSSSNLTGALSDTQTTGIKRVASSDVMEKRQKRMIKNRESAARSRARKQAYTLELENKVSLLEEENEWLKKQMAILQEREKGSSTMKPPEGKD